MTMEKFHYTTTAGKVSLPKFKTLKFGVVRKLRTMPEYEQVYFLLEQAADDKTLAILDELQMEELGALLTAWQEDSMVTVGESEAS